MKKYEMIKDGDRGLYRVKALAAFGDVAAGDTGGFVEHEQNLSHEGTAWIYGNARVTGGARVSGDTRVYGGAWVYDSVWIYGGAWGYSPLCIQGSGHSLTTSSRTQLTIGCLTHSVEKWLADYEEIGKEYECNPAQIEEYGLFIRMAAQWLKDRKKEEEDG